MSGERRGLRETVYLEHNGDGVGNLGTRCGVLTVFRGGVPGDVGVCSQYSVVCQCFLAHDEHAL